MVEKRYQHLGLPRAGDTVHIGMSMMWVSEYYLSECVCYESLSEPPSSPDISFTVYIWIIVWQDSLY